MIPYRAPLPASSMSLSASWEANDDPWVTVLAIGIVSSSVSNSAKRAAVIQRSSAVLPADSI